MRTGKIARLPYNIRSALNLALRDGAKAADLLAWLNALPEVKEILQRDFEGRPINEPNLSDWRSGGYQDWLANERLVAAAADLTAAAEELSESARDKLADNVAIALAAHCAAALRERTDKNPLSIKELGSMAHTLSLLRRGDHAAARVRIHSEHLKIDSGKFDLVAEKAAAERRDLQSRGNRMLDMLCPRGRPGEECRRKQAAIHGIDYTPRYSLEGDPPKSPDPKSAPTFPSFPFPAEPNPAPAASTKANSSTTERRK